VKSISVEARRQPRFGLNGVFYNRAPSLLTCQQSLPAGISRPLAAVVDPELGDFSFASHFLATSFYDHAAAGSRLTEALAPPAQKNRSADFSSAARVHAQALHDL